ncbi:gp61 [Rhodococcus phage ReqiPine5]|uniref:Gp61 n=1 Tax=Rhodococcus phage ReqiPine5 TaxID=691963 RepID=D4P836_9CAUD|nr:gp61 [Rhodococcus phage ReqiPine5]ADD81166.1 gp61 [Rhodococcus phage ReqiPine5]
MRPHEACSRCGAVGPVEQSFISLDWMCDDCLEDE